METRLITYTGRYSNGHLIPNMARLLMQRQYRVLFKISNGSLWYIFDILQQVANGIKYITFCLMYAFDWLKYLAIFQNKSVQPDNQCYHGNKLI